MGIKWANHVRRTGELKVFNKAAAWSGPVTNAIGAFNNLNLGVRLVPETEIAKANIVVKLSTGPDKHEFKDPWFEGTAKTRSDFKADKLHGHCSTLKDPQKNEIVFAVIFLPGKVKATNEQKQVIAVHEFIHACGLNGAQADGTDDPNQDHDIEGIMVAQMKESGRGLLEYMPAKGARAMPPIRISGKTQCAARTLWSHPDGCDE